MNQLFGLQHRRFENVSIFDEVKGSVSQGRTPLIYFKVEKPLCHN